MYTLFIYTEKIFEVPLRHSNFEKIIFITTINNKEN